MTDNQQKKSTVSVLAIIGAIGGVVASLTGHPIWGLVIGIAAFVSGLLGLGLAASPRISGGLLSIAAICLSIIGLALSILVAVGIILF